MSFPPPIAESISLQQALASGSRSQIESVLFDAISDVDIGLHPWVELMVPATAAVLVDVRGTGGGLTAALAARILKLSTFLRFAKRLVDAGPTGDPLRHAILSIPSMRNEHIDQLAPLAATSEEAWSVFAGPILQELDKRVAVKRAGIRARHLAQPAMAGSDGASPLSTPPAPIEPPDAAPALDAPVAAVAPPPAAAGAAAMPPPSIEASRPTPRLGAPSWSPVAWLSAGALAMLGCGAAGGAITWAVMSGQAPGRATATTTTDDALPTPIRNAELLVPRAPAAAPDSPTATSPDSPQALAAEIQREVETPPAQAPVASEAALPPPDRVGNVTGDDGFKTAGKPGQGAMRPSVETQALPPPALRPRLAAASVIGSAIDGEPAAQRKVGAHYFLGFELQRDLVLAAAWFDIAARQDASAARVRDKVVRLLPPEQRREAAHIAREWQPGEDLQRLAPEQADR